MTITILRRSTNGDAPAPPTVIFLDSLGEQWITLAPTGFYSVAGGIQPGHFWAIFSSSDVLLPDNGVLDRVEGAIDVGAPLNETAITAPSFVGAIPMDVAQDFFIPEDGMTIQVPAGANYLFVGIPDSYFADNWSPEPSELGLWVTTPDVTATPEPASMALVATGMAGIGAFQRRRRRMKSGAAPAA